MTDNAFHDIRHDLAGRFVFFEGVDPLRRAHG
jgi:hypothetical protein